MCQFLYQILLLGFLTYLERAEIKQICLAVVKTFPTIIGTHHHLRIKEDALGPLARSQRMAHLYPTVYLQGIAEVQVPTTFGVSKYPSLVIKTVFVKEWLIISNIF